MSTRRWFAWQAFRMRVSMSATGSVMLMSVSSLPAGLANAGDLALEGLIAEADPAQAEPPQHGTNAPTPLTAADRPTLELRGALGALDPTGLRHILLPEPDGGLAAERPAELAQERQGQVVTPGGGDDGDVHPVDLLDLVEVDLGEDHLLLDAERVVAPSVEALVGEPAEVAHPRDRHVDEAVQELVHPGAPEGHGGADRHPGPEAEVGDRLLGPGGHRALAAHQHQLLDDGVEQLGLLVRLAHPDVEDDLHQARQLVRVGEAELLHQGRTDHRLIVGLEA